MIGRSGKELCATCLAIDSWMGVNMYDVHSPIAKMFITRLILCRNDVNQSNSTSNSSLSPPLAHTHSHTHKSTYPTHRYGYEADHSTHHSIFMFFALRASPLLLKLADFARTTRITQARAMSSSDKVSARFNYLAPLDRLMPPGLPYQVRHIYVQRLAVILLTGSTRTHPQKA